MSNKITGRATISIDGVKHKTDEGATINVGGVTRKAVKNGKVIYGFQEEGVEPTLDCKIFHNKDLSLIELGKIDDATVFFETDTGQTLVLRNAFVTDPPSLDAKSGLVDLKMSALSIDEL